jgi:hypothetical protein
VNLSKMLEEWATTDAKRILVSTIDIDELERSLLRHASRKEPVSYERMDMMEHGYVDIHGTMASNPVINDRDEPLRQHQAVIHELIHRAGVERDPGLVRQLKYHDEVHDLASFLAGRTVTVRYYDSSSERTYGMNNLRVRDAEALERGLARRNRIYANGGAVSTRGTVSDQEWAKIRQEYPGWFPEILKYMFEAQSFAWPLSGVADIVPSHDLSGFAQPTFRAVVDAFISALDSGNATKGQKGFGQATKGAGALTLATATPVSCVGFVVVISDTDSLHEQRPVDVTMFNATGLAHVYRVTPVDTRPMRFAVIAMAGARRVGEPFQATTHDVVIAAGGLRTAAWLSIETINKRDFNF